MPVKQLAASCPSQRYVTSAVLIRIINNDSTNSGLCLSPESQQQRAGPTRARPFHLRFPFVDPERKTSLSHLWQTEKYSSISHRQKWGIRNLWERWEPEGVKNRTKGQSVPAKPQTSRVQMACAVSAVSRVVHLIGACLRSAGLLQSLTAGKTSLRLWTRSQEKDSAASLSQWEILWLSLSHSRRVQQQVGGGTLDAK